MATGGRSFIRASDIIHDFSCSPCSENKNNSEAIYKCVECKTFLCAKCRDGHNQFVKGHKVVDVRAKDIGGSLIHWKGYKCEEHPDKMIEMYCKTHDEVYCPVCILKHRSCTGVDYIPNVAKILLENQGKDTVETALKQQIVDLQQLKQDRLKYLSILAEDKDSNTKNIKRFKEELIKNAEEMEKSSLQEVENKYKAIIDDVNIDMEKIDKLINYVDKYLSKIVAENFDDDKDEVVTFKLSEHQVIAANKQILNIAWKKEEMVVFQRSTTLEKCFGEIRLGNLNIARRSLDTVDIYSMDESLSQFIKDRIQDQLLDIGIRSKVIKDLDAIGAGDFIVCVVSKDSHLKTIVNDLNKGNVKMSRRYKVLVVCLVSTNQEKLQHTFSEWLYGPSSDMSPLLFISTCRRLCTANKLPYVPVNNLLRYSDVSKAVQLIKTTLEE